MKHIIVLILSVFLLVGCNRSPSANTSRQASAPEVPSHSLIDRYLGEWQEDGETAFFIQADDDGAVTIQSVQNATWEIVINNVRWSDNTLCYDIYCYLTESDDYPGGSHPFSGILNEISLSLTDDPDCLKQVSFTIHLEQPIECALERAPNGG